MKTITIESCHDCKSYDGCENECMAAIGVVDDCPLHGIPSWCPLPDTQEQGWRDIVKALKDVTEYASRQYCTHEETCRGGAIWEICSMCGATWADDEGGKPADAGKMPAEIEQAYKVLASLPQDNKP